jgi:hypothetical protein
MACGDKYKHLVVTSSGYTPSSPGSDLPFAGQSVYAEWYELANKLSVEANHRFEQLGEIEGEKGKHGYPKWNALVELNNRMTSRYKGLTSPPLVFFDYAGARAQAQTVIADALCLMESSDAGIKSYGGNVPNQPGSLGELGDIPWWVWVGGGAVLTVGLGVTTAVLLSNRRRRLQPQSTTVVVQERAAPSDQPAAAA